MKGRKPLPTAQLRLQGTYRRDRRKNEPKLEAGIPQAPNFLDDEAKREWKRVVREIGSAGILTKADRGILTLYCQTWNDCIKLNQDIEQEGMTISTPRGQVVKNPKCTVLNQARTAFLKLACELGLTPSARSRVHALETNTEEDPLEKLLLKKNEG